MPTRCTMTASVAASVAIAAAVACGQTAAPTPAAPCACHAIIVSAMPGSPVYARRYQDWLMRFHACLLKAGVPAASVTVLSGDKNFKAGIVNGLATAEAVRNAIAETAGKCAPQDQFVLIIVGHSTNTDTLPALLLPGPDLTSNELADALAAVPAASQVILNFSACSGSFLKALAAKGRVNVAATSPEEATESVLPEFFLKALETGAADGEGIAGNAKDGIVTLLEALNWSSYQTAMWMARQTATGNETWDVSGKESAALFQKLCDGADNHEGRRKLGSGSQDTSDGVVEIVVPQDAEAARAWVGRRLVNEHAVLEDCGQDRFVSPLSSKGYAPITPADPAAEGALASKTVLGRCQPLEK